MAIYDSGKRKTRYELAEDQYQAYCSAFEDWEESAGDWVPSMEVLQEMISRDFLKNVPLLIWIDETGIVTTENKYMHERIHRLLMKILKK